jgi:hypothetical protein
MQHNALFLTTVHNRRRFRGAALNSHLSLQGIFQGVDRLLNPRLSGQGIADVKRPKTMPAGRRLLQQAQQGTSIHVCCGAGCIMYI